MASWIAVLTFVVVILLIVVNRLSPAVATLAGALVLIYSGVFTLTEAAAQITAAYSTLALLLGAMIVVRTLQPTGFFRGLARLLLIVAGHRGRSLLIGVMLITAALSAILPNASVVLLLGPVLIPLADEFEVPAAPLLILLALAANSGGLLTMVGDPATYLIAQAANLGFLDYLQHVSYNGVVAVGVLLLLLPWCWRDQWRKTLEKRADHAGPAVVLRWRAFIPILVIGSVMLGFFVASELLHVPFSPDLVALTAATGALILAERLGLGTVAEVLRDIDWSTLIFFACTFILIGALEETGIISQIAEFLNASLLAEPYLAWPILLGATAVLSSLVPNIPLIAALIPIIAALGTDQDRSVLYAAVLVGGTLGGNATMLGASANMVAVGLGRQQGIVIFFATFLRYGLPVCLAQVAAIVTINWVFDR